MRVNLLTTTYHAITLFQGNGKTSFYSVIVDFGKSVVFGKAKNVDGTGRPSVKDNEYSLNYLINTL